MFWRRFSIACWIGGCEEEEFTSRLCGQVPPEVDFADIRGQEAAKRAVTIAAAGGTTSCCCGQVTVRGKKIRLSEALQKVLKGRTLSVTDAVKAAVKAGYKTKSKNLGVMVNQALLMHTDKFRKVSRGQYTAR